MSVSQVEKIDDILLRHLISDQDRWWPAHSNLDWSMAEIEAEAVAYIVTNRLRFVRSSAAYVCGYPGNKESP